MTNANIEGAHQNTEDFLAKNVLQGTLGIPSAHPCQVLKLLTMEDRISLQKMMEAS